MNPLDAALSVSLFLNLAQAIVLMLWTWKRRRELQASLKAHDQFMKAVRDHVQALAYDMGYEVKTDPKGFIRVFEIDSDSRRRPH